MIEMANPSHGAVGGSTEGSPDSATTGTDTAGTTEQAVGPDQPVESDAEVQTAEDISRPRRDRKAPLGEMKKYTVPKYQEPDMTDWTDEARELWDLQNPKGYRPVATGEIQEDDESYGYEKDMVDKVVGRNAAGEEITVPMHDLADPVDEYHQSPTPDRSQVTGDGERLLAKWVGPDFGTRALFRDEIRSQIGADVDFDVVWSKANNHTVDITDFPEELQNYILVGDGLFVVTRVAPQERSDG